MTPRQKKTLVERLLQRALIFGKGNSEQQRKPGGLIREDERAELAELKAEDFNHPREAWQSHVEDELQKIGVKRIWRFR